MKKGSILLLFLASFFLAILLSSFASAAILVEKQVINDIVAKEINAPAKFLLRLTNTGNVTDNMEIYTYVDAIITPRGAMRINASETKEFVMEVYPGQKLREEKNGTYTFVYHIKSDMGNVEDRIVIRVFSVKSMLFISTPSFITASDSQLSISVENRDRLDIGNVLVKVEAPFLKAERVIPIEKTSQRDVVFDIDKKKLESMLAGTYSLTVTIVVGDTALKFDRQISLREKKNIETIDREFGNAVFPILRITKVNVGNVAEEVEVIVRKNAFAKAFTTFTPKPDIVDVEGLTYTYRWFKTLQPSKSFYVEAQTNYLLPLGILFASLIIVMLITVYATVPVVVRKKVIRVKTPGGEFALKVVILVKARRAIDDVTIRDRLPHLAELHERYGSIKPERVDKVKRMLEWKIPNMQIGEEHIFSYIMYSKVSVVGRFEIPRAFVVFKDSKGRVKHAPSNNVYFLVEERVV